MKVSKKYVLRTNLDKKVATYGTKNHDKSILYLGVGDNFKDKNDLGRIEVCNLTLLKWNIRQLRRNGFKVYRYSKGAYEIRNTFGSRSVYDSLEYLRNI